MAMDDAGARAAWVRDALARFEAPLVRYAAGLTGDLESARDVVQDTFLRLCAADRAHIEAHLAPWLYRVCRNRALDVRKKEQRMNPLVEGQAERVPSPGLDPGAAASGRETGARVRAAVSRLPEPQQEVFRLKFQDQLSYKEIGEVTGHPVNHVRYLIHLSLKNLRDQLGGPDGLAGLA